MCNCVGYLTGDSSGVFLFGAPYRAGFANQPTSIARDDGLALHDVYIGAAAHSAPTDNRRASNSGTMCCITLESMR